LEAVELEVEPFFGLRIPVHVQDVPDKVLRPRQTWKNPQAYDRQAEKLAGMFQENFEQFTGDVDPAIAAAGPQSS
jgi:phosphoenolpyruvate carboxykinase (ATP)